MKGVGVDYHRAACCSALDDNNAYNEEQHAAL